jgi:hypothetical protein
MLDELNHQTGLDLFFRLSDFSFLIFYAVAPTDDDKAAVASSSEAQA